jgi:hypothetical protein
MELADIRMLGSRLADTAGALPNDQRAAELRRIADELQDWAVRAEHGDRDAYARSIARTVLDIVGPDADDHRMIQAGRAVLAKLDADGWFQNCGHTAILGYSADDIAERVWFRYAGDNATVSWIRFGTEFYSNTDSNPVTARDVDRLYPLPGAGFVQAVVPAEFAGVPA